MEKKKLKKLVLKKEVITNLSDSEQSKVKGGGDTQGFWCYTAEYITYINSYIEPANCIGGYANSEISYCYCTNGDNTCATCNGMTCVNCISIDISCDSVYATCGGFSYNNCA
jgi:hypothetical protein